ncbi:MAG: hypothetical protein KGI25_06910 [Thaumarchaeota archaeon]|nr:hypothetical protein [Nitrososphaerota archaeon]
MNHLKTMGLFGIVAIAVGMVGINQVNANMLGVADTSNAKPTEKASMLGHITLVVKDPLGHIKEYRQTDNLVTNAGTDCTGSVLFGATHFGACGSSPTTFTNIGLSTSNLESAAVTDTSLASELTSAGWGSSCGLLRANAGSVSYTTTGSTSTGVTNPNTNVQISRTFTASPSPTCTGTYPVSLNSAGLFDAASAGDMFAEHAFGNAVSLNSGDSLTVTWSITLS